MLNDKTIVNALEVFVCGLLQGPIQAWINSTAHKDFRHRLDREQIANDAAFAIFRYLSNSRFIERVQVDQFQVRARRVSRTIAVRVTLDAIKYARRRTHVARHTEDVFCGKPIFTLKLEQLSIHEPVCQELLIFCTADWQPSRKRIIDLRMNGFSNEYIAKELEISVRQLQRLLKEIEGDLMQALTTQRVTDTSAQRISESNRGVGVTKRSFTVA